MVLSEMGRAAELEWIKTPGIRPDMNIMLDAYCVMPDHFHGIIIIGENEYNRGNYTGKNRFAPQRKNLASILRGYKSAVTMYARKNGIEFGWQARFHDHIIRDNESYRRIFNYIERNQQNACGRRQKD
jgi:REP element-mobilizing transposase RayT